MIDLRVVRPLQPSIVAKKVHSDSVIPLPEVVCPNMGQHFSDENHDGSSGMRMVRPSAAFLSTAGFDGFKTRVQFCQRSQHLKLHNSRSPVAYESPSIHGLHISLPGNHEGDIHCHSGTRSSLSALTSLAFCFLSS